MPGANRACTFVYADVVKPARIGLNYMQRVPQSSGSTMTFALTDISEANLMQVLASIRLPTLLSAFRIMEL